MFKKCLRAILVLSALLGVFGQESAEAASEHVRVLIHGHTKPAAAWGVAGWLVAPSITDEANKWMVILGPRFDGDNWWVEVMGDTL